jgi:hypothetical protein
MIFNERFFSENDFKTLLKSQRLDDSYEYFQDDVDDVLIAFSECEIDENHREYFLDKDNHWKPLDFKNIEPEYDISKIVIDLSLHNMIENSLEDFYSISCDVVNKINDYLDFYLLKETIYD